MSEPVAVAVLAKAPLAGFAKTRLIPVLGARGAALLQSRLIAHAVASACAAAIGPVTLWATPDEHHPALRAVAGERGVALERQRDGDLGARMLAALETANGPSLVIGTDCPALTPDHLRVAAGILRDGSDVVVVPAEDGGYVLIGMRAAQPALFCDMHWSTSGVMAETRRRLERLAMSWQEPFMLWDVDLPADLERMHRSGLQHLIPGPST